MHSRNCVAHSLTLIVLAGFLAAWCSTAKAQFGSSRGTTTTSSGAFGNRSVGGSAVSQNRTAGTSVGAANSGGSNLSQPQLQLPTSAPTMTQPGQGIVEMVGRQSFVGASSATATNLQALQGAQEAARVSNAVTQQLRTLINQQGRQNDFNTQQQRTNQGGRNQVQIRVPLRLGFAPRPVSATAFTGRLEQRLSRIPALQSYGQIEVEMAGSTAILRGTVASEADRDLAAGLARLEPEVSAVQNELVVAPAGSFPEALPPAGPQ